jgi:hypothetical protein
MLSAETDAILADTPMNAALDIFSCGLCKFICSPYPQQCSQCNMLFCEGCIGTQLQWQCPHEKCKTRAAPEALHRSVKEIIQRLHFKCPGCQQRFSYEAIFEHAA